MLFGTDYTGVGSTNFATVSGVTGAIGSFGVNVQHINMVTSGGALKETTSSLSGDGTSFSVSWISSGP